MGFVPQPNLRAVTGGVGGVAVTSAKNTKQAIGIGVATAYSNQVISSKGDDLSPKPSHIISGVRLEQGNILAVIIAVMYARRPLSPSPTRQLVKYQISFTKEEIANERL
uniref:hypothetical protein n=1 Tax=Moraxella bovis TaxID=476 RepID=UPI0015952879|nr:hypothetical protein [Moraxella bovis]